MWRGFFSLCAFGRPGGDLLSHVLRRSTIGAEGFHGRVRDGIGCGPLAKTTRSTERAKWFVTEVIKRFVCGELRAVFTATRGAGWF